jgi:hypothetical protein
MIAITSISPNHLNFAQQVKAIKSWQQLGIKVIAVQHTYDIDKLNIQEFFPGVTFVPTIDTMEKVFGKPYVKINTLIDVGYLYGDDVVMLINSDIVLDESRMLLDDIIEYVKRNEVFVYVSRWNYNGENVKDALMEQWGIDAFIFNRKHLKLIPKANYCMGQPRWDYWLPAWMLKHNILMYHVVSKFAYHRNHQQQWTMEQWRITTEWYLNEFNIEYDSIPFAFRKEHQDFQNASIKI